MARRNRDVVGKKCIRNVHADLAFGDGMEKLLQSTAKSNRFSRFSIYFYCSFDIFFIIIITYYYYYYY